MAYDIGGILTGLSGDGDDPVQSTLANVNNLVSMAQKQAGPSRPRPDISGVISGQGIQPMPDQPIIFPGLPPGYQDPTYNPQAPSSYPGAAPGSTIPLDPTQAPDIIFNVNRFNVPEPTPPTPEPVMPTPERDIPLLSGMRGTKGYPETPIAPTPSRLSRFLGGFAQGEATAEPPYQPQQSQAQAMRDYMNRYYALMQYLWGLQGISRRTQKDPYEYQNPFG
jgi:hypothetical protein